MANARRLPFLEDDSDVSAGRSSPVVIESDTDGASSTTTRDTKAELPATGIKLEWSSDDEDEAAYQALKNRKSLKRKRAHAEARQAKAEQTDRKRIPKTAHNDPNAPVVGRRSLSAKNKRSEGRRKSDFVDSDSELDDQLYDELMPDYVKDRKDRFERAKVRLGEAGLKLPPDYYDVHFSEDERSTALSEKPVFGGQPRAPNEDVVLEYSGGIIPAPIAKWLRPYQVEGAQFLHKRFIYQEGGILGDDMGLGKTIQVIAFLTAAFGKTGDERDARRMRKMRRHRDKRWYPRVLIVCPGSLMPNWTSELQKWGWWSIYRYHKSKKEKEEALQAVKSGMAEIILTTYSTYRLSMDDINTIDWDCVIADECHQLKTLTSEITMAMNNINALCRIGLTGTAIQNNYDELWCLLNWANPGVQGSRSAWRQSIGIPLRTGQAHDASVSELATARRTAQSLVKNLLPRFFLRRTKAIIADQLPKKSDRVVFCPLTDSQAEAYENFVMSDLCTYIRESGDKCDCGSGKTRGRCCYKDIPDRGPWSHFIFPSIHTLIKISNHIALLPPSGNDAADKQDRAIDMLELAIPDGWKQLYIGRDSIINFSNEEYCGKWKVLKRLLSLWYENGDKVLIFSHNVRLLKMLRHLFMATTMYNISYLDGSLDYEERQREVDDFNSNPTQFVFLISTKAGGVGLNITSANKVVIMDPNWNPSHDLQAQDRAYRLGQTRDVECFRLVSAATIEEIVYARQIYKQQQANIGYNASLERRYFTGVQDSSAKKGEIFGVKNLFAYQGDHVLLREIVNKTNIAETKAGVLIADLDLSQVNEDDDFFTSGAESQDAAINQLVERIKKGSDGEGSARQKQSAPARRSDAIQGILASVGVEYTHENSEVIGTSKIESKLSRRALEGGEADLFSRGPAFTMQHANALPEDDQDASFSDQASTIQYRYKPSSDIRKRQFCTMAKYFGFEDITEFALVVEGWTQEERRSCLEKFYAWRRKVLAGTDGVPSTKKEGLDLKLEDGGEEKVIIDNAVKDEKFDIKRELGHEDIQDAKRSDDDDETTDDDEL